MPCDRGIEDGDPATLASSLEKRMPSIKGMGDCFLREAADEFFKRSKCWRDQNLTLITAAGQKNYVLAQPVVGRIIKPIDVFRMAERDGLCPERIAEDQELSQDHEQQRWYAPVPSQIHFHYEFDDVETLRVSAALSIGDDNKVNVELLELHREAIITGAMYMASLTSQQKTTDLNIAQERGRMFDRHIREAGRLYRRNMGSERAPMNRTIAQGRGRRR